MSAAVHAWKVRTAPGWFQAWCGLVVADGMPHGAEWHPEGDHEAGIPATTCLHCIGSLQQTHLWLAEHSAALARDWTAHLERERRARKRRRAARDGER